MNDGLLRHDLASTPVAKVFLQIHGDFALQVGALVRPLRLDPRVGQDLFGRVTPLGVDHEQMLNEVFGGCKKGRALRMRFDRSGVVFKAVALVCDDYLFKQPQFQSNEVITYCQRPRNVNRHFHYDQTNVTIIIIINKRN